DEGAHKIVTLNQLDPWRRTRVPLVADLQDMQKVIFLRWLCRRDLDAPRGWNYGARIRRQQLVEVFTPERLPHFSQVRVFWKRPAFWRVEWPVLARPPCTTSLVARCPKLPLLPATRRHLALTRQKCVDAQSAAPLFVGEAGG